MHRCSYGEFFLNAEPHMVSAGSNVDVKVRIIKLHHSAPWAIVSEILTLL